MITVIDLNQIRSVKPLISEILFQRITETREKNQKVLLILNRRGGMSTLVCRDCGWSSRCPECDLLMRVHLKPEHKLLCHFCEHTDPIPLHCPKCSSVHLVESGARVQMIERDISTLFPDESIFLIEDIGKVSQKALKKNGLFIGTHKVVSLPFDNLGLVAFLLVESDLSVPEYNMEEIVYGQIKYFFRHVPHIILQTRSPKMQILEDVTRGNFRSFFQRTTQERKLHKLPPFIEMIVIRIFESSENTLRQRIAKLASSMMLVAPAETVVSYDHLLLEKRAGKYMQKIIIRSPDILSFLEPFHRELVRGRGIEVEWL